MAKRFKFTLPDDYLEALTRVSEQTGISLAELSRRAILGLLREYGENVEGKVQRGGKRPHVPPPDPANKDTDAH